MMRSVPSAPGAHDHVPETVLFWPDYASGTADFPTKDIDFNNGVLRKVDVNDMGRVHDSVDALPVLGNIVAPSRTFKGGLENEEPKVLRHGNILLHGDGLEQ